jgi:hypothetical protein
MLQNPNLWLFTTTLLYFVINGAGIYETLALVPKWSAKPPESLNLFKGKYTPDLKTFWIIAHSIHEIAWIICLVLGWSNEELRNNLLVLFGLHFTVRVWTIAYFAPNIIDFQAIANGGKVNGNLENRTTTWRNLNLLRTGIYFILSVAMAVLCYKYFSK